MAKSSVVDFQALRLGLASLPRTSHFAPGDPIAPAEILVVPSHRAALDPDRALVVGNRGVGKSYWTHVLAQPEARAHVAQSFPELVPLDVVIGFDASARVDAIAPMKNAIEQSINEGISLDAIWRTVLTRAAVQRAISAPRSFPTAEVFSKQAAWVHTNGEQADSMITALDDLFTKQRKKLVLVFDALDQLGTDWASKRQQASALLKLALAARSYRSIRLKLFMRRDQFEDPLLFYFADGSKIANQRVELLWNSTELYTLLFSRLSQVSTSMNAYQNLRSIYLGSKKQSPDDDHRKLVNALAGEFMGSSHKRGRVFSWLPLHLSDARGETSPRTFLTAWREAAKTEPPPAKRALDHLGIQQGVSKASEDRLRELKEDYAWIEHALQPLRGKHVPMDRSALKKIWSAKKVAQNILETSSQENALPPVRLNEAAPSASQEDALIEDLVAIGIVERRPNDKINVPDIFRLAAGIKRRGGVAAPKQAQRE